MAVVNPLFAAVDALPKRRVFGGEDWRLVHGECVSTLKKLPDKSVNLVFADPPYNLQLKNELYRPNMTRVNGVSDDWDKFASFADYDNFCTQWLAECRRVLKDDGAIWVIGTYHNIGRLGRLLQDAGYWLLNDVVWKKTNPMPNFRGVRFTNATETLLWAKKSEKGRYTFNYRVMKNENGDKQMTNVWSFPLCGGSERLRDADGNKLHSTQKPEALLRRVLLASSKVGDVVLDPFVGSGTTVAVARALGRIGIGVEQDAGYLKAAEKRIKHVSSVSELCEEPPLLLRVPFAEIIARGLIRTGQKIYTKDGKAAIVQQGGTVKLNGYSGSIHQVGAQVTGAPACNGWKFWFVKGKSSELISIDNLRGTIRKKGNV